MMARVSLPGRAHRDVDIWPRTRHWQTLIVAPESDYFEEENDTTLEEPAPHCFDQVVNISSVWMGCHFCLSCVFCVATSLSIEERQTSLRLRGTPWNERTQQKNEGLLQINRDMTLGWNVGLEGEKCGCCHNWGRACLWAGLVLQ